ncbi:MAG: TonB-dependent receptor [Candidatus Binatia bacterium]|nr:MAG: TonB-dependent receptor [Candidatus Binatia bacterium]
MHARVLGVWSLVGLVLVGLSPTRAQERERPEALLEEIVVEEERPLSAGSAQEIRALDYRLRPHETTQEILNNVPGLVVAQHQGGAKAMQWLVRGFDADHGTDFAVFVDDLPVNLPTHGHGQGYADTNFVIPETVERIQLYKGPYFVRYGDFANAGALNFRLKDSFERPFVKAEGGFWNTQRYVAGLSPEVGRVRTLVAGEVFATDGPFDDPQDLRRYNLLARALLEPASGHELSLWGSLYAGDWNASGQIPLRAVRSGDLGRFGSIDPSEGGKTDRENLNLHYKFEISPRSRWQLFAYAGHYRLRLFSDFTFFKETGLRFYREPTGELVDVCRGLDRDACASTFRDPTLDWVPGDGIEQTDERILYGGRLSFLHTRPVLGRSVETEVALETRHDEVDVALHRQVERRRFFTVTRVRAEPRMLGGYARALVFLTDWLRFETGFRWDVALLDVEDRLGEPAMDPHFESRAIDGKETDVIASPKASLVVSPVDGTEIYANFGTGFHSNDARAVVSEGFEPLTRSIGYELGARTRLLDRFDVASAIWLLDLDSELVFSGDAGTVEPSAASRRWGIDFEARARLTDWLFADYDLAYADPRFRASGKAVPLAFTLLMNGGLSAEFRNGFSSALRVRFLDNRPANEDRTVTAQGYTMVDLVARYRWRRLELLLDFLNVFDRNWREAQFADASCIRGELGTAPGCFVGGNLGGDVEEVAEDIHFTPGNPFWVRGGVTVSF